MVDHDPSKKKENYFDRLLFIFFAVKNIRS